MTTEGTVLQQLRALNPISDEETIDLPDTSSTAFLDALQTRRGTMSVTTKRQVETKLKERARRRRVAVALSAVVIVAAAGAGIWLAGGEEATPDAGGQVTIERYFEAFNSHDLEAMMGFFTDASQIVNHPHDKPVQREGDELRGVAAIRQTLEREMEFFAATLDAYTISNVEVSGNTVTWDHVWISAEGDRFCAEGDSATVEDGKILFWSVAVRHSCPS